MGGGFGYRNWNATLPLEGSDWSGRDEFNALSDRSFADQLRLLRHAGPLRPREIALISVVHNEAIRLPYFFEHYKKLGVTRFLMVDNASDDATPEVLLAEPLADIFHTSASFSAACYGIYWQNGMARSYGIGHWLVIADADELLVYDGMDKHSLTELAEWLTLHGQDRVFAPMIDLYPSGAVGETGLSIGESLEQDSWFDSGGYALQRAPAGWLATGGPRQRLFGEHALIHGTWASKYPFFLMMRETSAVNPHFIWPPDYGPARPLGGILHLKFLDDFAERSERNEREGEHFQESEKYRIINAKLDQQSHLKVRNSKSKRYEGYDSLVRRNLLMRIDWEARATADLPHMRTLGDIDYRVWTGVGRPNTITAGEREEFEDFSRRAFDAHLTPIRSRGALTRGEIGLVCVLRNEAARLPLFFDHYKRLGINRFLMIDNNSEDGSGDVLRAEPMADVFQARASFSEGQGGLFWAQAVARRYCEGNWVLRPDADELLVYDGMAQHDLHALAHWLERHGMDRLYAPMIDLYPSTVLGRSSESIEEVIRKDCWFDNDGYTLNRWPQGWHLMGGPRHRLFYQDGSHRSLIWKYPFFQMGPETLIYNHHWLWPHDTVTNGALGAMLHLKFMHDLVERSRRYELEGQHWNNSNAYRVINKRLKDNSEVMAFYEGSKRYRGPRSLLRHGMLMTIDWDGSGESSHWDGNPSE